jgi:hypothetical protein
MSNIDQIQDLFVLDTVQDLDNETAATCSGGVAYVNGRDPDVILYQHTDGQGRSMGVNASTGDGIPYVGDAFNDITSSIRILRGVWGFYEHDQYNKWVGSSQSVILGPGYYYLGANNDKITSLKRLAP